MKKLGATAFVALFLGMTLPGCGYVLRTTGPGYYKESTGTKIRPTDRYGDVQEHMEYWTLEEDGALVRTSPSGAKLRHKPGMVITRD
jgi:hypothetical protein